MLMSCRPRRFVTLCAVLLALPGCASWLLGADDDVPPTVMPFGLDATVSFSSDGAPLAGDANSGFVVTRPTDGGSCPAASTKCGDFCVSPSDPAYGCGSFELHGLQSAHLA